MVPDELFDPANLCEKKALFLKNIYMHVIKLESTQTDSDRFGSTLKESNKFLLNEIISQTHFGQNYVTLLLSSV